MKTLLQLLATGIMIVSLSGCGETSGTTSNDNNNGDKQNVLLEGGTINNPTPLQFEKVYNIPESYKTYVKVTVEQFQRITFDIAVDTTNDYDYYPVVIYDQSGNRVNDFIALGDTDTKKSGSNYHYSKKLTQDLIFLKAGTYMLQFTFEATHWRRTYTTPSKCELIAHNLGKAQLPKIRNQASYSRQNDYTYYSLEVEKDGDINFKGNNTFSATLYDYDLNIIENFDSVEDINITLPKGDFLFRPTEGTCTITFLNP